MWIDYCSCVVRSFLLVVETMVAGHNIHGHGGTKNIAIAYMECYQYWVPFFILGHLMIKGPSSFIRSEQQHHYCWQSPNLSILHTLYPAITGGKDTRMIEFLSLCQRLTPNLWGEPTSFSGWKPWPHSWKDWLSVQPPHTQLQSISVCAEDHQERSLSFASSKDKTLRLPHLTPFFRQLCLEILFMNTSNWIVDTSWQSPTCTKNKFRFVPKIHTSLLFWLQRNRITLKSEFSTNTFTKNLTPQNTSRDKDLLQVNKAHLDWTFILINSERIKETSS